MIGNGAINNNATFNWVKTLNNATFDWIENNYPTFNWIKNLERGTIFAYPSNGTVPDGALICNGSAVSRTTYNLLFAVIGTTFGAGNGSTTFNVPNLTDRFIQGSGTAGTVKNAGLPNITGELGGQFNATQYDQYVTGVFRIDGKSNQAQGGGGLKTSNAVSFNASRSSSIYGKSSTVQPPALTMKFYIKY